MPQEDHEPLFFRGYAKIPFLPCSFTGTLVLIVLGVSWGGLGAIAGRSWRDSIIFGLTLILATAVFDVLFKSFLRFVFRLIDKRRKPPETPQDQP